MSRILLGLFLILCLLPVAWTAMAPVLPIQDLPNHLASAWVLTRYAQSPGLQADFRIQVFLFPYVTQDLLLAGLMGLGADTAGKVLVGITLLSMPAGVLFLLWRTSPDRLHLAFLSLPLLLSKSLFKGNFGYVLGVGLVLICVGLLTGKDREQKRVRAALAVCCMVLYLTHLVAYVLFLLMALAHATHEGLTSKTRPGPGWILPLAPSLLLLSSLALVHPVRPESGLTGAKLLADLLSPGSKIVSALPFLLPFSPTRQWIALMWFGLVLGLLVHKRQSWRDRTFQATILTILIGIFLMCPMDLFPLVAPHERVLLLTLALLPACLGVGKLTRIERFAVPGLCIPLFLAQNLDAFNASQNLAPMIRDSRQMMRELPQGMRLMSAFAMQPYERQIGFGAHLDAYYVMDREGWIPGLFSSEYMLLQYRDPPRIQALEPGMPLDVPERIQALFVWGDGDPIQVVLGAQGFVRVGKSSFLATYLRR